MSTIESGAYYICTHAYLYLIIFVSVQYEQGRIKR